MTISRESDVRGARIVSKMTVAESTDDVPHVGRVANGGSTLTAAVDDPAVLRRLAAGGRIVRRWDVYERPDGSRYSVDVTPVHHWTLDRALQHVRGYVQLDDSSAVTHEEIAQTMIDLDCSVWHGAHVTFRRAYDDGRLPTDTCSLCGGRNRAGLGDHELCNARVARGVDVRCLDVVDSMRCGCAACERGIPVEDWHAWLVAEHARRKVQS